LKILDYVRVIADTEGTAVKAALEKDCLVYGNQQQLEEAVLNILSNAIKYSSGCSLRRVEFRLQKQRGGSEITIRDWGVGMTKEQSQHIFNRSYRAPSNPQEGYGLGLAITKRIVEQHNGRISVQSSVGKGTSIKVFIPYRLQVDVHP
jgi:signal transduction histidine kinase